MTDLSSRQPTPSPIELPPHALFSRLDHVGIAVWNADAHIPYYRDVLGLPLVGDEQAPEPGTRLVYFDAGNAFVQLVEPVSPTADIRAWLAKHGEGIHHLCLATDDLTMVQQLGPGDPQAQIFEAGRRRRACFLTGAPDGVHIEVTETHPSR